VQCPFFPRPSKKQLRACDAIRKKVTVVKGICLRAAEMENLAILVKKNISSSAKN
jgi:translation initiation factor 1 (eIF-1/SUI1)